MPPRPVRPLLPAALVFVVCAAAYFLTRTPALDEWDSVQFALGVGDFDLWRHQPHPPGYPLYLAFGWLAHHLLPLDVPNALGLVSALGGGLFVACWFVLVARAFGTFTAWVCTAALATLLTTWMSATKVLTDPAGAGLLALTLVFADGERRGEQTPAVLAAPAGDRWLAATAAAGAIDVGVRPQNFGVVLLILVLAVLAVRRPFMRRRWMVGLGVFLGVCLAWLLPTMILQARVPESHGDWLAYPQQLLSQWRWRLDQPKAYIGAAIPVGGQSRWLYRLDHHVLGLVTRGFGFSVTTFGGWLGWAVLLSGWILYARGRRDPRATPGPDGRVFWSQQLPWAGVYYLTVFCFLPGDQRYYLVLFPLLILPAVLGWQNVRVPGWRGHERWLAVLVPAATLAVTACFVGENHTEAAPPVRLMGWLQGQHPPAERPRVWLILNDDLRHAQWYAPDFHTAAVPEVERQDPRAFAQAAARAAAVYTDDPAFVASHGPPGRWRRVQAFHRSWLIYRKHHYAELYRWNGGPP